MPPQKNAKYHEKADVNVPRQANIYKKDDQVNDYHKYPQSHVRPSWPPAPNGNQPTCSQCIAVLTTPRKRILMPRDTMLIIMVRLNHVISPMAPLITVLDPP